jgi:hypothetical protein
MPCYWIKEGYRMEKMDTQQWFSDKLEQVKKHPAYLEEKRRLAMDELREKIVELLKWHNCYGITSTTIADQILALIKEEGYLPPEYGPIVLNGIEGAIEVLKGKGWKSPEEVEELLCPHEKECIAYMTLGDKEGR